MHKKIQEIRIKIVLNVFSAKIGGPVTQSIASGILDWLVMASRFIEAMKM